MPSIECCICGRPLGIELIELHHLIPKTFGGKITIPIHKICHRKIHATFTERELEKVYNTPEKIVNNPIIRAFVHWVSKNR